MNVVFAALHESGRGPSRHSRLVRETVAIGEQQTLTCASAEWLSSV
jgi:hypothetical protein